MRQIIRNALSEDFAERTWWQWQIRKWRWCCPAFLTDVPELYCGIPNSMQCILWLRFIRIIWSQGNAGKLFWMWFTKRGNLLLWKRFMIMKLTAFWKWIYPALRLMRTADLFMMEMAENIKNICPVLLMSHGECIWSRWVTLIWNVSVIISGCPWKCWRHLMERKRCFRSG